MRTFVRILVTALSIICAPMAAQAQGFLFGVIAGSSLSSGGTTVHGGDGSANVLYLMPRVAERISDPLAMRVMATAGGGDDCAGVIARRNFGNMTLRQHFAATVSQPERYEVLQVVRTMRPDGANCLWFTFIERDKIRPLASLPAQTPSQ